MLFKERGGTIWAGTNHGLYRFKGLQFMSVVPSIYVSRIHQAADGRLLLITGSGLVEYNGQRTTSHPGLGARFGVSDNEIFDAFEDTQGTTWYCTKKGVCPVGNRAPVCLSPDQRARTFVIGELSRRKVGYLHMIEARGSEIGLTDELHEHAQNNAALFRPAFVGPIISAAAYRPESAKQAVETGHVDAVAFGRSFIANPDLVERIKIGRPLNAADRSTFY